MKRRVPGLDAQAREEEETLEGVFLQSYNEPTIDRRFVDLCRTLFAADLPVAVLSNATGLTPAKVDALLGAGTLRYLCINLSTMDQEEYERDRHLLVRPRGDGDGAEVALLIAGGERLQRHDLEAMPAREVLVLPHHPPLRHERVVGVAAAVGEGAQAGERFVAR